MLISCQFDPPTARKSFLPTGSPRCTGTTDHKVRVTASSEPGSPQAPNEDAFFVSADGDTVAIFDGATARTGTGCIHSVAWYTHSLAGALAGHARLTPAKALAAAITDTAARHQHTCDLAHPGTPSAAVAIVQARRRSLHYLLLGDVTLVLDLGHGIRVLTDSRVHATARAERQAADELPSGSSEKAQALVRMKQAELTVRNVAGGYWLAAADPAIVAHAITGEVPPACTTGSAALRRRRQGSRPIRAQRLARPSHRPVRGRAQRTHPPGPGRRNRRPGRHPLASQQDPRRRHSDPHPAMSLATASQSSGS